MEKIDPNAGDAEGPTLKWGVLTLGPHLFRRLNLEQWVGNQMPVIYGKGGLSSEQISRIQLQLGFRLPDDFVYLLKNIRDPGGVLFPWENFKKREYDEMIAWVRHGVEYDVQHNNLWLERWGERPNSQPAALEIARADFATWPKLLPIHSHRFLAAEPLRVGNPVFSIMQTDIIYYGANLQHYLAHEFLRGRYHSADYNTHTYGQKIRRVDVWSDFAEGAISSPGLDPIEAAEALRSLFPTDER